MDRFLSLFNFVLIVLKISKPMATGHHTASINVFFICVFHSVCSVLTSDEFCAPSLVSRVVCSNYIQCIPVSMLIWSKPQLLVEMVRLLGIQQLLTVLLYGRNDCYYMESSVLIYLQHRNSSISYVKLGLPSMNK